MSLPANKNTARNASQQKPSQQTSVEVQRQEVWSGPLPPPESLKQFDGILEGGAERIFRMAEAEQSHRMLMERDTLEANTKAQYFEAEAIRRGTWLGAGISFASIALAAATAVLGAHPAVSVALVSVPVMSAVRAIILRK
jgi:uncharacterized membrane protein